MFIKTVTIVLFVALSGCAELEPLDDFSDSSESEAAIEEAVNSDYRKELGRQFLRAARLEFDFVNDPEVASIVNMVGKEIVKAAGSDPDYYHFFVIKNKQINAFAIPGGYIFLHDGLLKNLDSLDALAGVLAHEIAHVERDHFFKDSKKVGIVDLATLAGIILVGVSGDSGAATATIAHASNISYKLKLSREHEEDADLSAIRYLRETQYNPAGLSVFFKTLALHERLNGSDIPLPYLSTHPGVGERQVMVESLVRNLPAKRYPQKFARWDWERIVTILKAGVRENGNRFLRGGHAIQWNVGRKYYLRGLNFLASKNYKKALAEYLEAIRLEPDNPVYHADLANLYILLHHMDLAKKEALKCIELSEDYPDSFIVLGIIAKNGGRHEEAIKYFKEAEKLSPNDPLIHYHIASSYHALNMNAKARFHLGHYYRINLDQENAVIQFNMALKDAVNNDFAQMIKNEIKSVVQEGI